MFELFNKSLDRQIERYLYKSNNFKDYKVKVQDGSLVYLGHLANPDLDISLLIFPINFNKVEIAFHYFYDNWNEEGVSLTFNNFEDFKSYFKDVIIGENTNNV